ncbi:MAG: DHH family phosphoesterase [Flavobacteriales bacterium]|nr:DHH family phosphoesterase [Flavobacteriales bacterium]
MRTRHPTMVTPNLFSRRNRAVVDAFMVWVGFTGMVQMYLSGMEDVFAREEVAALKVQVKSAKSVVVTSHRSPDGDAIGSSLALKHMLSAMGVSSTVVMPDAYAKFLHWMPGQDTVRFHDAEPEAVSALVAEADMLFCLDYNAPSRAGGLGEAVKQACDKEGSTVVMIDHHQEPEPFADVMLSDPTTGSTCELIYRLLQAWDMEGMLDADMASCLYCGLITDTGSFRFSSVQPSSHEMASSLLATGMDHSRIHSLIYDACRLEQVQLTAYALSQKLQVFPEHRSAIISLSLEELQRYNAQKGDTEGLVNRALAIEGINFAAFIKEDVDRVKMSLRSRGTFSVRDVAAAHFNGGGHHNAAGGACEGESLQSVVDRMVALIPTWSDGLQYDD